MLHISILFHLGSDSSSPCFQMPDFRTFGVYGAAHMPWRPITGHGPEAYIDLYCRLWPFGCTYLILLLTFLKFVFEHLSSCT